MAADAANNRKSLNRALKGRLFLLVKKATDDGKFEWFFPVGEKSEGEKMRDAALRHVGQACGGDEAVQLYPLGFAPIGYVKYLHEDAAASGGFDGTKVFFYKSQLVAGDVALPEGSAKPSDYLWVTREELGEYLNADIADYVKKIVPP